MRDAYSPELSLKHWTEEDLYTKTWEYEELNRMPTLEMGELLADFGKLGFRRKGFLFYPHPRMVQAMLDLMAAHPAPRISPYTGEDFPDTLLPISCYKQSPLTFAGDARPSTPDR